MGQYTETPGTGRGGFLCRKCLGRGTGRGFLCRKRGGFLCRKGSRKGPRRVFLYKKGGSYGVLVTLLGHEGGGFLCRKGVPVGFLWHFVCTWCLHNSWQASI